MKKIIIPELKTSCGEFFYGNFCFQDNKMTLELLFQGSQLLEYVCLFFMRIVNGRRAKYLTSARRIFWRLNKLPITGSRKEMVEETFDSLISFISNSLAI